MRSRETEENGRKRTGVEKRLGTVPETRQSAIYWSGTRRGRETTKDCEEKVLAIINEDLGLNHIFATDISIAHRVGMRENRPRPIIVKFLSRKHKTQVIQKRGLLKWSGRGIVEDLTPANMKRLKSVQQHPEVKNSWTKEGMIHALLQNGKIVKITEGNLKIIDEAATGNAPVLDTEMSEVLAPLANAERLTRLQQQQTRNASLAASTPEQDSIFRSTHPSVPIRRKTSQAGNSDNRRPSRIRRPSTRERRPHAAERQPFSWDRWASPQGYTAAAGGHQASSPYVLAAATGDQRAPGTTVDRRAQSPQGCATATGDQRAPSPDSRATATGDQRAPSPQGRATATGDQRAPSPQSRATASGDQRAPSPQGRATVTGDQRAPSPQGRATATGDQRAPSPQGHASATGDQRAPSPQGRATGTITAGPCFGHWGPTGTITAGPCYSHWGPTGTITAGPCYSHWDHRGTIT